MTVIPGIHSPDDGRGLRRVLVNGREVKQCFFADTHKGIADVYRYPSRLDKHKKRVLTKRYHGQVTVERIDA